MMVIFQFLEALEVLFFQALNCFMYRMGVSRCQTSLKLSDVLMFTDGNSPKWNKTIFLVSENKSLYCHKIQNDVFDFMNARTIQNSKDSIIGINWNKMTFKVSLFHRTDPKIIPLLPLPFEKD